MKFLVVLSLAAALPAAIYVEHRLVARIWARYELARITLGVATVLVFCLPAAFYFDSPVLLYGFVWGMFGIAGSTTASLYLTEWGKEDVALTKGVDELRNLYAEIWDGRPRVGPDVRKDD